MTGRLLIGLFAGGIIGATMGYFGKCSSGMCPLTANPFRGAFFGAVMGALFSLSFGCRQDANPQSESHALATDTSEKVENRAEPAREAVIHINSEADFTKRVLESELPCLADFFSDSCPPCRMLAPAIESLAGKYREKAVVCKVSLDHAETHGLAQRYGITGIPAVLFFHKGKETERLVGLRAEEEYSRVLDRMVGGRDRQN